MIRVEEIAAERDAADEFRREQSTISWSAKTNADDRADVAFAARKAARAAVDANGDLGGEKQ